MVNKVTFAGFIRTIAPTVTPTGSTTVNPFSVNVIGDGFPGHQPCDMNVTAVKIKLTEM